MADDRQIIVRTGSSASAIVITIALCVGAFFVGSRYERARQGDYRVSIDGVPSRLEMTGAPEKVLVTGAVTGIPAEIAVKGNIGDGIPREIAIKGAHFDGIPNEITFKNASLDGILPKEINVQTAAVAVMPFKTVEGFQYYSIIAVTPRGEIWLLRTNLDGSLLRAEEVHNKR